MGEIFFSRDVNLATFAMIDPRLRVLFFPHLSLKHFKSLIVPFFGHMPRPSARTKYFLSWTNLKLSQTKFLSRVKNSIFSFKINSKWNFLIGRVSNNHFHLQILILNNFRHQKNGHFKPGQNIFCPGQYSNCPGQKFCPGLKSPFFGFQSYSKWAFVNENN